MGTWIVAPSGAVPVIPGIRANPYVPVPAGTTDFDLTLAQLSGVSEFVWVRQTAELQHQSPERVQEFAILFVEHLPLPNGGERWTAVHRPAAPRDSLRTL